MGHSKILKIILFFLIFATSAFYTKESNTLNNEILLDSQNIQLGSIHNTFLNSMIISIIGMILLPFSIMLVFYIEREALEKLKYIEKINNDNVLVHKFASEIKENELLIYHGMISSVDPIVIQNFKMPFEHQIADFDEERSTLIENNGLLLLGIGFHTYSYLKEMRTSKKRKNPWATSKSLNFPETYSFAKIGVDQIIVLQENSNCLNEFFKVSSKYFEFDQNNLKFMTDYLRKNEKYKDYYCFAENEFLFICKQNLKENETFSSSDYIFQQDDLKFQIKYLTCKIDDQVTFVGEIKESEKKISEFIPHDTQISKPNFCCCEKESVSFKWDYFRLGHLKKEEIYLENENRAYSDIWVGRILGFCLLYISIILILYSIVCLLWYVPFFSAFTYLILIFSSLFLNLMIYSIFYIIAWIFAEPYSAAGFSFVFIGSAIGLYFISPIDQLDF